MSSSLSQQFKEYTYEQFYTVWKLDEEDKIEIDIEKNSTVNFTVWNLDEK